MDTAALAEWIAAQEGLAPGAVDVGDVEPIVSVGNARQPWRITVSIDRGGDAPEVAHGVMLVKAAAGQLETELPVEFAALCAVHPTGVPVAEPLWLDADGAAIGRPFFVTRLTPGTADMSILRAAPEDATARATLAHLAEVAAALHLVDPARADATLLAPVSPDDAARTALEHWAEIAERQRIEPQPALRHAIAWLREHAPVASRVSIVHGDLRVGNFLALERRVTALLDWEMVHVGDPLEDLAWAYRAIWSPARVLPLDDFLAIWSARTGIAVDPHAFLWHRMLGEVKHAVISLTAARSFHERRTTNLRMADRNLTVAPFLADLFTFRAERDAMGAVS